MRRTPRCAWCGNDLLTAADTEPAHAFSPRYSMPFIVGADFVGKDAHAAAEIAVWCALRYRESEVAASAVKVRLEGYADTERCRDAFEADFAPLRRALEVQYGAAPG